MVLHCKQVKTGVKPVLKGDTWSSLEQAGMLGRQSTHTLCDTNTDLESSGKTL